MLTPEEIWDSAITLVPHLREDRRIERKPPRYDARALGDYFSMWANTAPDGGLIVVGIADKGELVGFQNIDSNHVNTLEATGPVYCPDARFTSKRLPIVNTKGANDFVLLFRIYYHKSKVVKTVAGEAFHRIADRKLKLVPVQKQSFSRALPAALKTFLTNSG